MDQPSKFIDLLNEHLALFSEGRFVKGNEESELPPMGDEEEDQLPPEETGEEEQPEGGEDQLPPEETGEEEQPEQDLTVFTDREQDILNVALQIYRANPENSVQYKNEFSNMYEQGQYEELLGRLIAIADELSE
jgi:hypothetical protein